MEFEEWNNRAIKGDLDQSPDCSQHCMNRNSWSPCGYVKDVHHKQRNLTANAESKSHDDVEQKKHEELSVGKAYTVGDPGTVMIHV